jgi:hypothetical protein
VSMSFLCIRSRFTSLLRINGTWKPEYPTHMLTSNPLPFAKMPGYLATLLLPWLATQARTV